MNNRDKGEWRAINASFALEKNRKITADFSQYPDLTADYLEGFLGTLIAMYGRDKVRELVKTKGLTAHNKGQLTQYLASLNR